MDEAIEAFASGAADSSQTSRQINPMALIGIHSFPAWRSTLKDSVKNKPASLLVLSLGKALNGIPQS